MKRIVLLDTTPSAYNLGNYFIMEAIERELREIFIGAFFHRVPALEPVVEGRRIVAEADHVFLCGTNVLSADMNRTSEWRVRPRDRKWLTNVVLVGVGWWQYQEENVNRYTRRLLRALLHPSVVHSVRDAYTERRLDALGFAAVNTGCPTLWTLTPEHCAAVPTTRSDSVVLTFTDFNQIPERDVRLFELLAREYDRVFFWPQGFRDYLYAQSICSRDVIYVDPSIDAYDALLREEAVDYVGLRLHAGIRALHHGRRAIVVAIDNRAAEMARDFALPSISRLDIDESLAGLVKGSWTTSLTVPWDEINAWRAQFGEGVAPPVEERQRLQPLA